MISRAQALSSADAWVAWAARERRNAAGGQLALFGGAVLPMTPAIADILRRSPSQAIRAAERRALGFSLSGHPVSDAAKDRCDRTDLSLRDGWRVLTDDADGSAGTVYGGASRRTVAVVCVVTRVLERKTRSGEHMAVLWLEDDRTRREAVCFPRQWLGDLVSGPSERAVSRPHADQRDDHQQRHGGVADVVDPPRWRVRERGAGLGDDVLLLDVSSGAREDKLVVERARRLCDVITMNDRGGTERGAQRVRDELLGDFVALDIETCTAPIEVAASVVKPKKGRRGAASPPVRDATSSPTPIDADLADDRASWLARQRVVEVGLAVFRAEHGRHPARPGRYTCVQRVSRLCDPGCPIDAGSRAVHGITDADVRGQPTFAQRAAKLADALRGRTVVVYNGRDFDLQVLAQEFAWAGVASPFLLHQGMDVGRIPHGGAGSPVLTDVVRSAEPGTRSPSQIIDAYDFVEVRYPGRRDRPASKKLSDQAAFCGVETGQSHRAADDARTAGMLLVEMVARGWAPRELARLSGEYEGPAR